MKEKEVILSLNHIDITFGKGRKLFKAVSDVSFDIYKGETVSLVGESGSGKTTIGRAVVRVNPLSAGYMTFKGNVINGRMPKEKVVELRKQCYEKIEQIKAEYDPKIIEAKALYEKTDLLRKEQEKQLRLEHLAKVKDIRIKYNTLIKEAKAALDQALVETKDVTSKEVKKAKSKYNDLNAEMQVKLQELDDAYANIAVLKEAREAKENYENLVKERKDQINDYQDRISCANGRLTYRKKREFIRKIQMVFQDPSASLNERATIDYIISEGLHAFHLYKNEKERVEKVERIIKEVGLLPEHLTRYPHEFSGGQRQRVGLARSVVMDPEFIVADEPISALDVSIRAQVLNLLKKFQAERDITYLFIAHDLSIVRFISDRIVVIHLGKIVEIAETEELFNHPLHPYTKSLMSAIPIPDPILEKNKNLITYNIKQHNYKENEKLELVDIGHGHFVYGNEAEIKKYRKIREEQGN